MQTRDGKKYNMDPFVLIEIVPIARWMCGIIVIRYVAAKELLSI